MNGPPLPLEERQQSLRKDFIGRENRRVWVLFLFFWFPFWRDAEGGGGHSQNEEVKTADPPELLPNTLVFISSYRSTI